MSQLVSVFTAPHVKVRPASTDAGNGIFGTKDLSPGESVITVENPLIVALDAEKLESTCYQCYRPAGDFPVEVTLGFMPCLLIRREVDAGEVSLSRCAGCKVVKYCGKSCQKLSWTSHHSLECPIFKAIHPQILPNHIRAILRFLLLRSNGRIQPEDWDTFMACPAHLNSHNNRREECAKLKAMAKWVMRLGSFSVDEDTVLQILMRLKINSMTLQAAFHDPLGLVLHPMLAKANHSCNSNCYIRFIGPSSGPSRCPIILTPRRKIRSGEELTISYVEETIPIRYRRQELSDRYFFTCNCSKCTNEEREDSQLDSDIRTGIHKVQDSAKLVLATQDLSSSPESRAVHLKSEIRNLFNHDRNWPLARYPFPQLLHQLMLTHIDTNDFPSAICLLSLLRFRVDTSRYTPIDPMRLTPDLVLIKLIGAVLDTLPPATTDVDLAAMTLSKEIDLEYWVRALTKSFITEASKTWKEQPWPWLKEMSLQREAQSSTISKRQEESENRRMEESCQRTLDGLK